VCHISAALAEFRCGCAERGRSIFEGVLANAPKRTDLWNVYIDQVCVCVCVLRVCVCVHHACCST
jgi:hypothetical protein